MILTGGLSDLGSRGSDRDDHIYFVCDQLGYDLVDDRTVTLSVKDHKTITYNSHYYNVAHCSKVLQPGAVRLGTKGYETSGLTYQWYRNPDGSQALLLLNENSTDAMVNFVTGKH